MPFKPMVVATPNIKIFGLSQYFHIFPYFNTYNHNIYLPKTKKMTDTAKTLDTYRKNSILNVFERRSVYLDHKKFYGGGFQTYVPPHPV